MNRVNRYFRLAKLVAEHGGVRRQYRLGAVGIRTDGAIVMASNLSSRKPEYRAHAEARLTRKLNIGSEVFIVRILRNGSFANARPCRRCQTLLKRRGVRRCYYSISDDEYGVIQ